MRNSNSARSGFFNLRVFFAFALCVAGACLAMLSLAAPTPVAGTLSTANRSITYTDSVGSPPNLTGFALGNPNCGPNDSACSVFNLTIDPSISVAASGYDPTQYQITVQWVWSPPVVDNDVFIKNAAGVVVAKNQSSADPSTIILPTNLPPGVYKLVLVLSTGAPVSYSATAKLEPAPIGPGLCNPATGNCSPPRFMSYPAGAGQADDAGEPSLGVDWNPNVASLQHDKVNTGGVAFFTSGNHEWRVNFDDCSSPAIYNWEDVSAVFDQTAPLADPIGFVDHYSSAELGRSYPPPYTPGRIFCLQLVGGQGNSLGAFSDNDGNSYLPGGNGGAGQGPDHETLGAGPYSGTPPNTLTAYPSSGTRHAVYYCSQDIAAEAQCARSDDGGQTFGPAVPLFNPTQCTGGIHGHVKVAPDGTAYVPNSSCGTVGTTGVAVSTDNGMTWRENNIPDSTSSQDPYVAIGQNNVGKPIGQSTNTIYLGYVDGNGHPKVALSHDRGVNWSLPVDLGVPMGVTHAVFPIAAAGDDNRAAIGFLGTSDGVATSGTCDPYGATLNCANIWHLYVATTYDGGQNWIVTDATPDDPVQTGTVCLQGTTCMAGRNLADFNDMAIDSQGRILAGYADGCVNCSNTFSGQSSASHGTVSRQSGGRRLFAFFDPTEPAAPAAPQMVSATAQPGGGALVKWIEPDNGGSPITGYKVYRGTTSGAETFLADVAGETTTKYLDPTPPSGLGVTVYYYVTAVNALPAESTHCREVTLVPPPPCLFNCGNVCTFPYQNVAGPGTHNLPDPTPGGELTIQYVNLGEPFTDCTDNSVTFLIKVNTLDPASTGAAVLPENADWQMLATVFDTNNVAQTIFVSLDTFSPNTPANPRVSLGRRDPSAATNGTVDTRVCTSSSTTTCDLVSAYYLPDGTIAIKLKTAGPIHFAAPGATATGVAFDWNPASAGTLLKNVSGTTYLLAGAGAGFLETIDITNGTSYTRLGNTTCVMSLPIARMTATPMSGKAPLNVAFDASSSSNPSTCVAVTSYTLDFGDGAAPVTQGSPTFNHTYTSPGDYPARLMVKDANNHLSTNPAQIVINVTGGLPPLSGAVSRKTHGSGVSAPVYDVNLPLTGNPGIEPRTGTSAGIHKVVLVFENTISSVASISATATTASGQQVLPTPTGSSGTDAHQYTVDLTSVPNAAHVVLTLHGVTDSQANTGDISIPMDVLAGDTTIDRSVNSADISQTKARSGSVLTSTNFRNDVNIDGSINSADISLVKSKSGTGLP